MHSTICRYVLIATVTEPASCRYLFSRPIVELECNRDIVPATTSSSFHNAHTTITKRGVSDLCPHAYWLEQYPQKLTTTTTTATAHHPPTTRPILARTLYLYTSSSHSASSSYLYKRPPKSVARSEVGHLLLVLFLWKHTSMCTICQTTAGYTHWHCTGVGHSNGFIIGSLPLPHSLINECPAQDVV